MPPENLSDNILASPYFENSFPCINVNSFTFGAVYLIVPRNMGLLPVHGPDKNLIFEDVHFFPVGSFYLYPTIRSGYYMSITYILEEIAQDDDQIPKAQTFRAIRNMERVQLTGKESACQFRREGSIPGLGRSPG